MTTPSKFLTPPPLHPLIRAGNVALEALAKVGLRTSFLRSDTLLEAAARRAGLRDFGTLDFVPRLERLLESARSDAHFTPVGAMVFEQFTLLQLVNRLEHVEYAKRHPEALEAPVRAPLFVVGLPRTGTTLLQRLLSIHPDAMYLPLWLQMHPYPPPSASQWAARGGWRARRAGLKVALSPTHLSNLPKQHTIGPQMPEECRNVMTATFLSPTFSDVWPVLGYSDWLRVQDAAPSYRYLREVLQLLQHRLPHSRWVLKDPWHLGHVELLLELFPNATLVFTHRDPLKSLASSLSETVGLHGFFSSSLDREWSIRTLVARTQDLYRLGKASRQVLGTDPRVFDVHFKDFMADPVALMRDLHQHFGYRWDSEVEAIMKNYMAENPRHKAGKHTYSLEDYGICESDIQAWL